MPEVERDAIVLPWNNLEAVERILSDYADEIAAVICEPVPCVPLGGTPPQEGLLHALRELTQRIGALLIFDEVVTGLRMREGSASAHFGITPDLITLGKVAGGGLPIGVYGGTASIMELVVGPGADPERKIFQSGTFSGSPVVMAAGIALIDRLADGSAHECADAQAERLRDGLRDAAASVDLAVQVTGMSSWFGVYFTENPIRSRRDILTSDPVMERAFSVGLLGRGVFLKPGHPGFTSAAHTSADIDHVLEHAAELLGLIARCGQR
jgi:glutamate-1-semialdehyde 2,1-aminomutase